MRVLTVLLALVAAFSLSLVQPARAGLSDQEKVVKLVRKYAVDSDDVFSPDMKPKTLCYCTGELVRTLGFLVFNSSGLTISCAIPTNTNAEGEFLEVDYNCPDFEILAR